MAGTENTKTRQTLLLRIREPADARAWREFTELYLPLLKHFIFLSGVSANDVDDVGQEVMRTVAKAIRSFQYEPERGTFRSWLFIVTRSRVAKHFKKLARTPSAKAGASLLEIERIRDGTEEQQAEEWEKAYRQRMFEWAAPQVRQQVKENTWRAFWMTAVEGRRTEEVATLLEMTLGGVYVARSRVIAKLRARIQEVAGEKAGGDPLL
jgi:RNA polymerase sigma factor (sigma-70 family)